MAIISTEIPNLVFRKYFAVSDLRAAADLRMLQAVLDTSTTIIEAPLLSNEAAHSSMYLTQYHHAMCTYIMMYLHCFRRYMCPLGIKPVPAYARRP